MQRNPRIFGFSASIADKSKSSSLRQLDRLFFSILLALLALPPVGLAETVEVQAAKATGLPDDPRDAFLHRTWQFEDGLPHNTVHTVTQTRDGYLWVGTLDGLARFDGDRFTVFRPENTPGLKSADIRQLLETRDGSLWIATDNGLSRLQEGTFSTYSPAHGLAGPRVRELHEMADGSLWIGTVSGLSIFANDSFQKPQHEAFNEVIRAITQHPDGTIWVAGARNLFSLKDGQIRSYGYHDADVIAPIDLFRALTTDKDQALWGGSMLGLTRFQEGEFTLFGRAEGLPHDVVNRVFQDSRGTIWAGTHGGLSRFHNGILIDEFDGTGHAYDVVYAIAEDREGHLWIGSRDGLSQLRPRPFNVVTTRDGLGHNNIMGVLEGSKGQLWVATWGGGVQAFEDGEVKVSLGRPPPREEKSNQATTSSFALSILETKDRGIWVGMDYDHGIYRFQDGKVTHYNATHGLSPSAVRVLYEDRSGTIWAGTYTGLHRFQDGRFTLMTKADGLAAAVSVIAEDRHGTVWFGSTGGLARLNGRTFSTLTTADGLPTNSILFVYPDEEDNLWIGTRGAGLVRLRDNRFTHYTVAQGLFTSDIISIVDDELGNLWMGTRYGIFRVSKDDLDAIDRDEADRFTSTSYGKYDGLLSIQCNGAGKPAVARTGDGRIWFATTKGLAVVDPATLLQREPQIPPVKIERLVQGEKSLHPSEVNQLSDHERHIEIHYTALSFSGPERNRFMFKLEGFDDDWVNAGTRRVAYYSNLPPGDYTFRVRGANSKGVWNEEGAALSFHLAPRFYETAWFLLGCVILLGGAGFGAYHLRLRRLTRREMQLRNLVDTRTRDLQAEVVERRQAEDALRESQDQAMRRERLAVVGQLSAGMAHEFNNLLTVVQGHTSLLLRDPALPKPATESLHSIAQSSERGALLIQQMLAFSRKQTMEKTTVDLNLLIEGFTRMLERVLGETSRLTCQFGDSLPCVEVDAGLIEQCLVNLALNARDAMPGGGTFTITTTSVGINRESAGDSPDATSGAFVCLSVSDTGCGMDTHTLHHLFEPFFTTKEVGKGSGLGLASVYGIIRQHDGWIDVNSTVGHGTTFKIYLPASQRSGEKPGGEDKAENDVRGGTETILVVEDETTLRQLISIVLKRAGYTVLEAESGPDALELCAGLQGKIDLLLTDMVMPGGISGSELARQLRSRLPHLRVVMTSGYSEEIQRSQNLDDNSIFLAKPHTPQKLIETVRAALDSQRPASGEPSRFSIFKSGRGTAPRDAGKGEN